MLTTCSRVLFQRYQQPAAGEHLRLDSSPPGEAAWRSCSGSETPPRVYRAIETLGTSKSRHSAATTPALRRPGLATVTRAGRRSGPEPTCPRLQGIPAWEDVPLVVLFENLHAQEALGPHPRALRASLRSSCEVQAGPSWQAGPWPPAGPLSVGPLLAATCWSSARQPVRRWAPKPGDKARRWHRAPRLQAG